MAINFAAASTAGLNNPGTEIITLVKDGSGNFVNPPSYDKMLAYLRSGDVPCLFVTDEAGTKGNIYQLSGYSETENKIRFTGGKTAIEFSAGSDVPVETEIGGGGGGFEYDFIIKSTDGSAFTLETGSYNAIAAKIGNEPVMGKIILNAIEAGQQKDMDCVLVIKDGAELKACAYTGETYMFVAIGTDGTVTLV